MSLSGSGEEISQGLRLRLLAQSDLPAILALQARVRGALPDPAFLADDPPEFFAAHLGDWGVTGGVEHEGELVAFGVIGFGGLIPQEENFGRLIGLPPDRLVSVGQPDGVAVAPGWRGRGLQRHLLRWRLAAAVTRGCRDILSTCEPRNVFSLRNMMGFGLRAVRFAHLFNGLPRLVLHCDRQGDAPLDMARIEAVNPDAVSLSRAFEQGLVGFEVKENHILMAPVVK